MKHTEAWKRSSPDEIKIGLISISDRASKGIYTDEGVPALRGWLESALSTPYVFHERLIADEREVITETIVELTDDLGCDLVLTTGGTGPSRRDVTPEATMDAGTREMPGFGEQMRQISLRFVPTAILSRQTAVLREIEGHTALVINLPGQPKSIKETLEGLKDAEGKPIVQGIFASVPYCIELIGGPIIQTHESVIKVYRPKSAVKK
jgi:molybdopterin adenylyltransferase